MVALHDRRARRGVGPGRRARVVGATALMLVAMVVLLIALGLTTLSFLTPSARPGGASQQHEAVWAPGVVAAGVTGLAVLSSLGWLVWNWVTLPPTRWWWPVTGLIVVAVVITAAACDTPNF